MTYKKRVYSGICTCGHKFEDHHLGVVMNADYREATGESYIAQECEFYGFNETGGLDNVGEPHCFNYRDKDDPEYQPQHPVPTV